MEKIANCVQTNLNNECDEDLTINFEKIFYILWNRKELILKVFLSVLLLFIAMTFVMPKKYRVTADLYVHKANNSNMVDVNPYVLDEAGNAVVSMSSDKAINNEIELMKSALVLDKVIKDNNIIYKKGKKKGELLSAKAFLGKGKVLKLQNTKNTNVITIQYTSSSPEFAYNVVASLISNYIDVHKDLNAEKAKSDKKIVQAEYQNAKKLLHKRLTQASGLPSHAMGGVGNLSALSAFSKSAQQAIGSLKWQYLAGERSQIAVNEEAEKVNQLSQKLAWAKMVEEMSDSSKVLVLSPPILPEKFENVSPNLFINIILGCLFGVVASLIVLIFIEIKDEKLTYSQLTDNIIFNADKNVNALKVKIIKYQPQKILLLACENNIAHMVENLKDVENCDIAKAEITSTLVEKVSEADNIMIVSKIAHTPTEYYKAIREIIDAKNKKIVSDVLI